MGSAAPQTVTVTVTKALTGHGITFETIGPKHVITAVKPNGAAGKTNSIFPGMSIVAVNGNPTAGLTKKQCTQMMRKSPKQMALLLEKKPGQ